MTILIFFAVLVVLILVHEFGHFIVAKRAGIRVDEFGIGFPPKIFGKRFGETEYTINLLPIGGFVRIWGEDPTEEHYEEGPGSERSFVRKSRIVQAAVLLAGVSMNVLLAFVLYVVAYTMGMPTAIDQRTPGVTNERLLITSVLPESPAFGVLKPGDEIVRVRTDAGDTGPSDTLSPAAVSDFIASSDGAPITISIIRRGDSADVSVTPKAGIISTKPERIAAGFTMSLVGVMHASPGTAIVAGAVRTGETIRDVAQGLLALFSGLITGTANLSQVSGPVGIVGLVGDAAALGFVWLLTFTAFISLNLAVINVLPIPALDGGRLLFVLIEAVTGKTIKPIVATRTNQIGFVALLVLMAVVTLNDVFKLFS